MYSSEKPPVVNPFANNEPADAPTRAQADVQNTIGNKNRAAIGDSTPYGEGTKYYNSPEYAAAVEASTAQTYRNAALQRTQQTQQSIQNSLVSRGAAYEMAMEAERKGETLNPYVAEKAIAQGYVPTTGLYSTSKEASRQTVPTRDYSSGMSDSPVLMNPGGGADVYVPYGSVAKTLIPDAKVVYTPGGQLDIYKTPDARPGFTPRYGMIVSSGSDNSLQSGMFTVGSAGTPVVYTRESAGTKFAPGVNATEANAVLAHPELYSRSGAELYGGDVVRLDARTIQASTRIDPQTGARITVTNTPVSTYPASKGNLAGLVDPFAVNKPKAERVANTPWTIDYANAPIFQVLDQEGNLSQAPADRLANIGFKAQPIRENVSVKDIVTPSGKPLSVPRYGEPSANADVGVGWHTVDGVDYAIIPGGNMTLPASRSTLNTADVPVLNTVTGILDTGVLLTSPLTSLWRNEDWQQKTFGQKLNIPTTTNAKMKTEGGKTRGDIAEYFNAPITVPISKTPTTTTTGYDAGIRLLGDSLTAREPELRAEGDYLDRQIPIAKKEGDALNLMFTPGGNWVDKEGYWTGTEEQLAAAKDRAAKYDASASILGARAETYNKNVDIFKTQATQFDEQYKKNPEMVSTNYAFGDPIRGKSGWDKSNIGFGDQVLIQPIVSMQSKFGINGSVEKVRTNWDNTIYNTEAEFSRKPTAEGFGALVMLNAGKVATDRPLDLGVKMGEMYAGGMVFRALSAPTAATSTLATAAPKASFAVRAYGVAKAAALPAGMVGLTGYQGYEATTLGGKDTDKGRMVSRATDFAVLDVFPMFAGGMAGYQNPENVASLKSAFRPGGNPFGGRPFGEGANLGGGRNGGGSTEGGSGTPGMGGVSEGHFGIMPKHQLGMTRMLEDSIRTGVPEMTSEKFDLIMYKRQGKPGYPEKWSKPEGYGATVTPKTGSGTVQPEAGLPQPTRFLTDGTGGGGVGKVPQPSLGGTGIKLPEMPTIPKGSATSAKLPVPAGQVAEQPLTNVADLIAPKGATKMPGGTLKKSMMVPEETISVSGKELAMRSPGGVSAEYPTLMGSTIAPAVASAGMMEINVETPSFPSLTGGSETPPVIELPPPLELPIEQPISRPIYTPRVSPYRNLGGTNIPTTMVGKTSLGTDISNIDLNAVNLNRDVIPAGTALYLIGDVGTGKQLWTTSPEVALNSANGGKVVKYVPQSYLRGFVVGGENSQIILPKRGLINYGSPTTVSNVPSLSLLSAEMKADSLAAAAASGGDMGIMGMEGIGIEGMGDMGGYEFQNMMDIPTPGTLKTGLMPQSLSGKQSSDFGGTLNGKLPWDTTGSITEPPALRADASPNVVRMRTMTELIRTKKVGKLGNGAPYFRAISNEWMAARNAHVAETGIPGSSQWKQIFPFEVLEGGLVPSDVPNIIGRGGKRFGIVNAPRGGGTPRLMALGTNNGVEGKAITTPMAGINAISNTAGKTSVRAKTEAGALTNPSSMSRALAAASANSLSLANPASRANALSKSGAGAGAVAKAASRPFELSVPKFGGTSMTQPVSTITSLSTPKPGTRTLVTPMSPALPVVRPSGQTMLQARPRPEPRPSTRPRPEPTGWGEVGGFPTVGVPPIGFPSLGGGGGGGGGGSYATGRGTNSFREHSATITPGEMARSLFTGSFTEKKQPAIRMPAQKVYGVQKGSFRTHTGTVKIIPMRAPKKGRRK